MTRDQKPANAARNDGDTDHDLHVETAPEAYEYQDFPSGVLPQPLRGFVREAARAIGCDASFIGLPLLCATASAIGNTRVIQIKRGWTEPAILWTAVVGESGTLKSPAQVVAIRPLRHRQETAIKAYQQLKDRHNGDLVKYDQTLADWKKHGRKLGDLLPAKPSPPVATRYIVQDTTLEALAGLLRDQPRGLLVAPDELNGWLASFDRYRKGHGGDLPRWLEMWQARTVTIDRKGDGLLHVPRASVSICGGIVPEVLANALGTEGFQNGLSARLLLTAPPRTINRWRDDEVDPLTEAAVENLFDRLLQLDFNHDQEGEPIPVVVPLSEKARQAWVHFVNQHAEERGAMVGAMAAAYSKLEGYAARFALIFHMVRAAAEDPELQDRDTIDGASMATAIQMVRWFGNEVGRIYSRLHEGKTQRMARELVELIQARGGSITVRDLSRCKNRYRTSAQAKEALQCLAGYGFGMFHHGVLSPQGGRPTEVFTLSDDYTPTDKTSPLNLRTSA